MTLLLNILDFYKVKAFGVLQHFEESLDYTWSFSHVEQALQKQNKKYFTTCLVRSPACYIQDILFSPNLKVENLLM